MKKVSYLKDIKPKDSQAAIRMLTTALRSARDGGIKSCIIVVEKHDGSFSTFVSGQPKLKEMGALFQAAMEIGNG